MERIILKDKKAVLGKFLIVFFCAFLSMTAASCGGIGIGQTVSNKEITTYLNEEYFQERSIDLLKIKDVVEYPGDTKNEITLTCTTVASNDYATQTANWKLTFELFSGSWLGRNYEMGMTDCEVRELTVDELGEIVCPEYGSNTYFEVLNLDTNSADKIVTASTIQYRTFPAYYISVPWTMRLFWDSKNMRWTYDHYSNSVDNRKDHGMNWQIHVPDFSGHYEIDELTSIDITCDSEDTAICCIDNWHDYHTYAYYNKEYTGSPGRLRLRDSNAFDDGLVGGFELYSESGSHASVGIRIEGDTLYAGSHPLKTITSEFVPQESYLQGTFVSKYR